MLLTSINGTQLCSIAETPELKCNIDRLYQSVCENNQQITSDTIPQFNNVAAPIFLSAAGSNTRQIFLRLWLVISSQAQNSAIVHANSLPLLKMPD